MSELTIYYDAICPSCQRDRQWYSRWVDNKDIEWCDINNHEKELLEAGINPQLALESSHKTT